MGEEETYKVEPQAPQVSTPSSKQTHDSYEKAIVSFPTAQKETERGVEKIGGDSKDRDAALARLEVEKRLALIKAWEESEKTKADNKAHKKLSSIQAWENTKKALVEAQLKQIEEKYEKKKTEYGARMKNKMAEIHMEAEEKRALIEAKRGEDIVEVEETAAKFRATGILPKKLFACFSC